MTLINFTSMQHVHAGTQTSSPLLLAVIMLFEEDADIVSGSSGDKCVCMCVSLSVVLYHKEAVLSIPGRAILLLISDLYSRSCCAASYKCTVQAASVLGELRRGCASFCPLLQAISQPPGRGSVQSPTVNLAGSGHLIQLPVSSTDQSEAHKQDMKATATGIAGYPASECGSSIYLLQLVAGETSVSSMDLSSTFFKKNLLR